MANRYFTQFQYSLEKKLVTLFCNVSIGATGAPTLNTAKSKGIKSVVRNSTGNYTVTFQDTYQMLLFMDHIILAASGAPSAGTNVNMIVRADNSSSLTAPSVQIEFVNSAGAAVELANGATLLLSPQLRDSTAI